MAYHDKHRGRDGHDRPGYRWIDHFGQRQPAPPHRTGCRPLVLAQAGHQVTDGEGNLISFTGLNIPAGSDFCSALSA